MYLIVGLGNPPKQYEQTRHNAGFMALDAFAKQHNFPEFTLSKKHSSLVSEGFLSSTKQLLSRTKVLLAKPQTFMNNSGKAVASLVASLPKASSQQLALGKELELSMGLVVVHDEIDIPLGQVRVSESKGSAGHKGVDSIIQSLGTKNFTRVRIGIQPKRGKLKYGETFVLKKFAKAELPIFQSAIQKATESLASIISA